MKSFNLVSLCSLTLLAVACGGNRAAQESKAPRGDGTPTAEAPATSSGAFPAEAEGSFQGDSASAPRAAPAPAGADFGAADEAPAQKSAERAPSAAGAAAPRSESRRSAEPFDLEQERPGLGTTWGETRTSHVSSAPFERANPRSPFALTTVHYNDRTGVAAQLRGASLADFRHEGVPAARGFVTVRLIDDNGVALPTLTANNRSLVIGEHGNRYSIEIQNHSENRFEAVVTVDGLDVIDGKPGSFSKRGYLIAPFATVEIDGFRQSMDEVAAFRFGSVRNSYAGKKGDDRNVGVIGVALFEERGASLPWTESEIRRRNTANPFPGGFAQPPIAR